METTQFAIESKSFSFPVSLRDFTLGNGHQFDADQLVSNTLLSLYCLDDDNRSAIFVELPQEVDLTKSPFVYYSQFDHAQSVISVPYETFMKLGDDLPAVERPIMVYMTGRSGSTLLSHILNESGEVVSLSEPEAPAQFSYLWSGSGGERKQELVRLAISTARFLFRPYPTGDGKAHAIKLRSEGLLVMDLFQAALPEAKNLFSYRDALGWVTSFNRLQLEFGTPLSMPIRERLDSWNTFNKLDWSPLTVYLDPQQTELSMPEFLTLWWIFSMETYLTQMKRGMTALPIRFNDLIERSEQTLQEVFDYCELSRSSVEKSMHAFGRDSQAGTWLARRNAQERNQNSLTDEQIESVNAILLRHPVLNTFNFIVPRRS